MAGDRVINPRGQFKPGNTKGKGGRPKGVGNKIPTNIALETYDGFAKHGSDGKGKDGFVGYIYFLAKNFPESAAHILGKLLPREVKAELTGNLPYIGSVNIVSVPPGHFVTKEVADAQRPQLEPPLEPINGTPVDQYDPQNITLLQPHNRERK